MKCILVLMLLATPVAAKEVNVSWYGGKFHGRKTASGQIFNQNAMTAAHKTMKFGTKIKLTYKGKSVIVTINDRGPFIKNRTFDISKGAAKRLKCMGVCRMQYQKVR
jgi:rare lipoprotein A